tara:strand:+ start:332 stop:547 length:216 start_codon:yes stop_codon:yes gene_type:complete
MDYAVLFHAYHISSQEKLDAYVQYQRDNDQIIIKQIDSYRSFDFLNTHIQPNNHLLIKRSNSPSVKLMIEA